MIRIWELMEIKSKLHMLWYLVMNILYLPITQFFNGVEFSVLQISLPSSPVLFERPQLSRIVLCWLHYRKKNREVRVDGRRDNLTPLTNQTMNTFQFKSELRLTTCFVMECINILNIPKHFSSKIPNLVEIGSWTFPHETFHKATNQAKHHIPLWIWI